MTWIYKTYHNKKRKRGKKKKRDRERERRKEKSQHTYTTYKRKYLLVRVLSNRGANFIYEKIIKS
jgi:hypothetical protein